MRLITLGYLTLFTLLLSSCMAQPQQDTYGTLKGTIGVYEGNCMPGPGVKPCEPRPISTAVFISSLTETYTEELLVKQIQSNNDGTYEVLLPPGKYSLFLGDGDRVVCTLMQCPNTCFCNPFEIVKDSTTVIDAELDHATW